jgi:uncharacterized protein with HEPN domain
MSKASRVPDYLEYILSAIKRIERYITDVDEFVFLQSELLQDAVVRNIGVIGEAANNIQRVAPSFVTSHSDIPWQVMCAMRNRLSHGYDKIDFEMVWKTVCNDLPAPYQRVKAAKDTHKN